MEAIVLVISVAYFVMMIAGVVMEKKLRAKYNGAVGLLNSYLFTGGLLGGFALIMMLVTGAAEGQNPLEVAISGLACLAIAGLLVMLALKKCPEGSKSIVGLMIAMLLVGASVSLRIVGFLMKLVFHFDLFAGRNPGAGYANWYKSSNGAECQLWTSNGSYAVLKGPDGACFNVYPHGNDGLVCDDNNNLYTPM